MIRIMPYLFLLLFFSCSGNKQSNEKNNPPNEVDIQNVNLLSLSERPSEFMEALTSGVLVLDKNGCLKVGDNTIIWPYGYKLGEVKNAIYNEQGKIVAEIGNQVQLSGGECSDCPKEQIRKLIGSLPNNNCTENYWIVGEEIKVQ